MTFVAPNGALEAGLKYKPRQRCKRELGAITRGAGSELAINTQGRFISVVLKDGMPDTRYMSARLASDEQRYMACVKLWANNHKKLADEYLHDVEDELLEERLLNREAQATIASQAKEIEALETLRKMERAQWKNNIRAVVEQRTALQAENAALQAENAALKAENAALKKAKEEAEARGACVSCCTYTARWMYEICEHVVFCDECVDRWPGACPICRKDSERVPVRIVNGVQAGDL